MELEMGKLVRKEEKKEGLNWCKEKAIDLGANITILMEIQNV